MKVKIKETGEVKDLTIRDEVTQTEITLDMLCQYDTISFDEEEVVELTQEQFDWWHDFATKVKHYAKQIEEIARKLHISKLGIWAEISEEFQYEKDLENYLHVLNRILIKYKKEVE